MQTTTLLSTDLIEVFKTNVPNTGIAHRLTNILHLLWPNLQINWDLEDRDRILRIQGESFDARKVCRQLETQGYFCEVLED